MFWLEAKFIWRLSEYLLGIHLIFVGQFFTELRNNLKEISCDPIVSNLYKTHQTMSASREEGSGMATQTSS